MECKTGPYIYIYFNATASSSGQVELNSAKAVGGWGGVYHVQTVKWNCEECPITPKLKLYCSELCTVI